MKMKQLPKEKRDALILTVVLIAAVLAGLGFGLIRPQFRQLASLAAAHKAAETKLAEMKDAAKHASEVEAEVAAAEQMLAEAEKGIASGDVYDWVINTVRDFKAKGAYQVDILQFSPIGAQGPVNLLPGVPYKQASLSVVGSAYFHDFGRFIADFENTFPNLRVVNLTLEPSTLGAGGTEKLSFKIDLVTLVRSNPS
jgi:hypothetical protein